MNIKKPVIGLLFDFITEKYQASIWKGIVNRAEEKGVNIVCFLGGPLSSPEEHHKPRNIIYNLVEQKNIDGLIIMSATIGNFASMQELTNFHNSFSPIPIVSLGSIIKNTASILIDNTTGMIEILEHLIIDHRYKKLAFIKGTEGNTEAELRFAAYKNILKRHKIQFNPELVSPGDFTFGSGTKAVSLLIDKRKIDFEAIVASNDTMAIEAMEELKRRNIRVPHDISVVGFDDIEAGEYTKPPLTTVTQPLYEIGVTAIDTILSIIKSEKIDDKIILPTKLKIRHSCGCNPSAIIKSKKQEDNGTDTGVYNNYSHEISTENLLRYLHRISIELITSFNTDTVKKIMIQELPQINIKRCYIFRYADESLIYSKPFFGYSSRNNFNNNEFELEEVIPSTAFVNKITGKSNKRFAFIVMSLYFKNEQLGFIVFEIAELEGIIYETLAIQISAALKGALLIEKIKNHSQELEIEVAERTKELAIKNEELKKLDTLKNDFIANITHDFRSPLTAILNTADLALRFNKQIDSENKENYSVIYDSSIKLKNYIDRLLDLAKMDAYGIRLKINKTNIISFLESIINYYKSALINSNIKIIKKIPKIKIDEIYIDNEKLEEVINNIISNAIKFTDPIEGIIEIELIDQNDSILIKISDNGIGIPKDKLKIIFNRFEQLNSAINNLYGGSGIGLAYSKQLTEYMKGEIWAESEGPGNGAKFFIKLKKGMKHFSKEDLIKEKVPKAKYKMKKMIEFELQKKLQKDQVQIIFNGLNKENEFDYKKGKILIIDDDEHVSNIVMKYLIINEYKNFIISNSGKKGLDVIYEYLPDLIICDYNIPDLRGDEIHDKISNNPKLKNIPFIFLSAITDRNIIMERREKGASSYLKKPIDERDLAVTVEFNLKKYFEYLITLRLATIDELTGLYNKREIQKRFFEELAIRKYRDISIIFCDLDYFKEINDEYGHQCGDNILKEIGTIFKESLRDYDIPGRYGGDEFIILLPDTNIENAIIVAEMLRNNIVNRTFLHNENKLTISSSFGITSLRDNDTHIMKQLKINSLKDIFEIKNPKSIDWSKIKKYKQQIEGILLDMADHSLYKAKTTLCNSCSYSSEKKGIFINNRCPKCSSRDLTTGRNKIIAFES